MRNVACILLMFLLLAGKVPVAVASFSDSASCVQLLKGGFNDIYNFRFKRADSLTAELKKRFPGDEKVYILEANSCWWKLRSGEESERMKKEFLSSLTSAETLLEKKKKDALSYADLFNYIHVYSYMSRLELLGENYFKAFSFISKCSRYLFASFGKERAYEPFFLTTGLYAYALVAAREKYPPLIPFLSMLPSAGKEDGIGLLKRCSDSQDAILSTEGQYFLMVIYGESDIDYALSQSYAVGLCERYPSNLLYRYYLFKVLLEDEKKEPAMKEYNRLYMSSLMNKELSPLQQKHFLSLAQKDLETYYKKHPSEGAGR